ncbi:MAG TPA: polysaccharide deacetylase family protein [Angustibacter sp.]|nr:polysaccharide deacetylase family protein [Angustibacter sp.]
MPTVVRLARLVAVAALVSTAAACGTSPGSAPSPTPTAAASSPSTTSAPPTPSSASTSTSTTSSSTSTTTSATTASGLPAALLGRVITRLPTTRKVVALTFDAGASADGVASILRTLKRDDVPASFFLTGDFAEQHPDGATHLAAYGRVGNHTSDHLHLTTLTTAQVRAQVTGARTTIRRVTGEDPLPFFRFPFGEYDTRTLTAVNELGYAAIGWTVDSLGWKGTSGGQSVESVVARVLGAAVPGEIVLMHVGANPDDGTTLDADALPDVIAGLRAKGYGFVTLDALLG